VNIHADRPHGATSEGAYVCFPFPGSRQPGSDSWIFEEGKESILLGICRELMACSGDDWRKQSIEELAMLHRECLACYRLSKPHLQETIFAEALAVVKSQWHRL